MSCSLTGRLIRDQEKFTDGPIAPDCIAGRTIDLCSFSRPPGRARHAFPVTPRAASVQLIWPAWVKRCADSSRLSVSAECAVRGRTGWGTRRAGLRATMDHADIRGLGTALHRSVAGLPRSSIGDHRQGCPHSRAEGSPHRVPRIALPIRCGVSSPHGRAPEGWRRFSGSRQRGDRYPR